MTPRERPVGSSGKGVAGLRGGRVGRTARAKKAQGTHAKPKDRWFDPGLTIAGDSLRELARPLVRLIDDYDRRTKKRRYMARGPRMMAKLKDRVEVVAANLAYAVVKPPPTRRLAVSLMNGTRTRYDNPLFRGDHLRSIIAGLEEAGLLKIRKGNWAGHFKVGVRTTIEPTQEFASDVAAYDISPADFGRSPDQEVLLLKRADPANMIADADEQAEADDPDAAGIGSFTADGRKVSRWVDYADCDTSLRLRSQVVRLGEFIAEADIRHALTGEKFDRTDCLLRRHFTQPPFENTPRWDLNGRLFYRRLSHLDRTYRKGLTINGSQVAELDFKSMFATLAYGVMNTPMPVNDAYRWQGLEAYRDGVKMGFNALLFGGGRGEKFANEISDALPKALTPEAFRQAFLSHHPALEPLLSMDAGGGLPIGYALMYTESRIMVAVLERLMERRIAAIGLHDGIIIGAKHVAVARKIMTDTAQEVAGVPIPVELKDGH